MHYPKYLLWLTGFILLISTLPAFSLDYIRLRDGRVIEGAIIRQDTSVLYLTDWDSRSLRQPPLQVFSREEIESIWFVCPQMTANTSLPYRPHPAGWEIGGGLCLQTWNETAFEARRYLVQTTLHGGYTVTKMVGLEADLDLTFPFSAKSDSSWHKLESAAQVSMNVIFHPFVWKGMIPFLLVGGGTSTAIPLDNLLLVSGGDSRSLINAGLGVKWGSDKLGVRLEWRHSYYIWNPDKIVDAYKWEGANLASYSYRLGEQSADASVIKIGLFYYH